MTTSVTSTVDVASLFESMTPRYPELKGQVAMVTGAAKGIGQGIAVRLAAEGMRIVAADIDAAALDATVHALRDLDVAVLDVIADVGRVADIEAMFASTLEAFGTVDLLVNNAANLLRRRFLDEHGELLDTQLATNVVGPYLSSQRAAAIMREAGGGSIVHISSVGALRAHHRAFPYDITKGALNALTLAMAVELGAYGIRVNAIGPGVTHTYRTDGYAEQDPESYRTTAERIPIGRWGTVSDIGAMVAFLASPDASYVTGQTIYVDGGISAQLSPQGPTGLERGDRINTTGKEAP